MRSRCRLRPASSRAISSILLPPRSTPMRGMVGSGRLAHAPAGGGEAGGGLFRAARTHAQIADEAVFERIAPAMHGDLLATRPGVAHDRVVTDVDHLLHHVQLAQPVV